MSLRHRPTRFPRLKALSIKACCLIVRAVANFKESEWICRSKLAWKTNFRQFRHQAPEANHLCSRNQNGIIRRPQRAWQRMWLSNGAEKKPDSVWMLPNQFNIYFSPQCSWSWVHLSSAQTIKSFKQDSSDWLFLGHMFSTRFPLSPDTRWCHGSLLACKRASTIFQLFWLPHLSQDMFITYRFRPKINVRTKHPGWVMNPACLAVRRFRSRGRFLPVSSLCGSSVPFTFPCLCTLFLFTKKY